MKALFLLAEQKQPAVVFIDEVDSLLGTRSSGDDAEKSCVTAEFLTHLDGVTANNNGVFFLFASNLPWALDSAFRRRCQQRLYIPLPGCVLFVCLLFGVSCSVVFVTFLFVWLDVSF